MPPEAISAPAPAVYAEPTQRLDRRAITLWRIGGALSALPLLLAVALIPVGLAQLTPVSRFWQIAPAAVAVPLTLVAVWFLPGVIWRHWHYDIREDEVDLQRGILTTIRTLIPMARIQHVDTRRGPLQRRFGLASVILYTAAGASEIPALADDVAATVRHRIAALANVHDDL